MTALAVHDEPPFRTAAEAAVHYRAVHARLRRQPLPRRPGPALTEMTAAPAAPAPAPPLVPPEAAQIARMFAAFGRETEALADCVAAVAPKYRAVPVIPALAILEAVAARTGVSVEEIRSNRRTLKFIEPRHIAMTLVQRITQQSSPQIGRLFGGRDHTSVLKAITKITAREGWDPHLSELLASLEHEIREAALPLVREDRP